MISGSSAAEQEAVNFKVVGSNPTRRANENRTNFTQVNRFGFFVP